MVSKKLNQAEIKAFLKQVKGVKLVKDKRKEYVAVLVNIPQKGGGFALTAVKKGIAMTLPALRKFTPITIATFLTLVSWELVKDIISIAKELSERKETDESTSKIIKDAISRKYSSPSVALKKLLAIPLIEGIVAGITLRSLATLDKTGNAERLMTSMQTITDSGFDSIQNAIKTCPECYAVGPVRDKSQEYFDSAKSFIAHVATHKRKAKTEV
jgi:hypothetical protein